jgi:hypothetical protein
MVAYWNAQYITYAIYTPYIRYKYAINRLQLNINLVGI